MTTQESQKARPAAVIREEMLSMMPAAQEAAELLRRHHAIKQEYAQAFVAEGVAEGRLIALGGAVIVSLEGGGWTGTERIEYRGTVADYFVCGDCQEAHKVAVKLDNFNRTVITDLADVRPADSGKVQA